MVATTCATLACRTHTLAQEVVHGAGALELTKRGCAGSWETIDFYQLINGRSP